MWVLFAGACVVVTLAGCISGGTAYRLPPLHIARLQRLDAVSNLSQENADIMSAIMFQRYAAADQLLLDVVGVAPKLAVVNLNGSGYRDVPLTSACNRLDLAVTPDGAWGVCLADDAHGHASKLEITSLDANASSHWEAQLSPGSDNYMPAWSPDGQYLALLDETSPSTCEIDVYAQSGGYKRLTRVTTMTSTAFTSYGACLVSALGWSGDGARLLVAVTDSASGVESLLMNEQTPIATLLQEGTAAYDIPVSEFVSLARAVVSQNQEFERYAWNPVTGALAYTLSGLHGGQARVYVPRMRQTQTLLTFPDPRYQAFSLSWAPDGIGLAMVIGAQHCVDCGDTPLYDVYLYTPATN
jgi:Tol biopolymer transport system component